MFLMIIQFLLLLIPFDSIFFLSFIIICLLLLFLMKIVVLELSNTKKVLVALFILNY